MRIFITGATGWVGSAVVEDLIAAGHQVVGIVHRLDDADDLHRHHLDAHRATTQPRAASQATCSPAAVLSPLLDRPNGFSRREPANLGTLAPYHTRLARRKRALATGPPIGCEADQSRRPAVISEEHHGRWRGS